jgi:hypothetical protein
MSTKAKGIDQHKRKPQNAPRDNSSLGLSHDKQAMTSTSTRTTIHCSRRQAQGQHHLGLPHEHQEPQPAHTHKPQEPPWPNITWGISANSKGNSYHKHETQQLPSRVNIT